MARFELMCVCKSVCFLYPRMSRICALLLAAAAAAAAT